MCITKIKKTASISDTVFTLRVVRVGEEQGVKVHGEGVYSCK